MYNYTCCQSVSCSEVEMCVYILSSSLFLPIVVTGATDGIGKAYAEEVRFLRFYLSTPPSQKSGWVIKLEVSVRVQGDLRSQRFASYKHLLPYCFSFLLLDGIYEIVIYFYCMVFLSDWNNTLDSDNEIW